jgi:LAO/AO transport system kinase
MDAQNTGQQASILFQKIRSGDRIALSRAITLIESRQEDHLAEANALLDLCMTSDASAMRIAISGAPGVGKSSLIEAMSVYVLKAGYKLAVLAVDPTSQVTGGSILGDKTRMQSLAGHPNAYVRPSPAGVHPGGVAERTREAVILCEAAGYDVIIVETVGVGQSETQVSTMVDLLTLLIAPGGGDEVQGIKRGILEVADLVIVNKADGEMKKSALETKAQYSHALRILHAQESMPTILTCSALDDNGVEEVWMNLKDRYEKLQSSGQLDERRNVQQITWFEFRLHQEFLHTLMRRPDISVSFNRYKQMIAAQEISVRSALTSMQAQLNHIMNTDLTESID